MSNLIFSTHFTTGGIEDIHLEGDNTHFRWVRGTFGVPLGMNYLEEKKQEEGGDLLLFKYFNDLSLTVRRQYVPQGILEEYTFVNASNQPIDLSQAEYGVSVSFADGRDIKKVALPRRAYSRAVKTDNLFFVYNSRVGGQADGVGLVLTQGVLGEYKAIRYAKTKPWEHTLFLPKVTLEPQQSLSFSWLIFYYQDLSEFCSTVAPYLANGALSAEIQEVKNNLQKQGLRLTADYSFGIEGKVTPCFDPVQEIPLESRKKVLAKAKKAVKRLKVSESDVFDAYLALSLACSFDPSFTDELHKALVLVQAATRSPLAELLG